MPGTVRPRPTAVRAGTAVAAVVLVLTSCGGDRGGSATGSSGTADAAGVRPAGPAGGSAPDGFCDQAAGIDRRVDSALAQLEHDDPSLPDALRRIAVELRGITPPEAIASDWKAMAVGLDRTADELARLDVTDLDSLGSLERVAGDLTASSTGVEDYLHRQCGL